MATTKPRVSVIRISRQSLNQTNPIPNPTPTENHHDTDKDTSTTHLKLNHIPRIDKKSPTENHHDTDKDASTTHLKVNHVPRIDKKSPIGNQYETDKDASTSHLKLLQVPHVDTTSKNKKEQNDISRAKTDMFTTSLSRVSDAKSDDLNQKRVRIESARSSIKIQQQPTQANSWMNRSSNPLIRPELTWKATGKWSHGICSLFEDFNMCCYACACWCCFRHELSSMMGEHWCLWFLNCAPLIELRTKFRQQYGIQGSIAEDCFLTTFCPLCTALQLANEGRDYGHRIFS